MKGNIPREDYREPAQRASRFTLKPGPTASMWSDCLQLPIVGVAGIFWQAIAENMEDETAFKR